MSRSHVLEVPDPDKDMVFPNRRYQIVLSSSQGAIEVAMIETAPDSMAGDQIAAGSPTLLDLSLSLHIQAESPLQSTDLHMHPALHVDVLCSDHPINGEPLHGEHMPFDTVPDLDYSPFLPQG